MMKRALAFAVALVVFSLTFLSSCDEKSKITDAENDTPFLKNDHKIVICLDPGHGFDDIGCTSEFFDETEKEITVDICNRLKEKLEKRGLKVVLTHNGKAFPKTDTVIKEAKKYGIEFDESMVEENNIFSKYERAYWENILYKKGECDLFISIHVNSIEGYPEICGSSVDYCEENENADLLDYFSKRIKERLESEKITDKTTIYADTYEDSYVVNRLALCPSVLIECAYASNKEDAEKLISKTWRNRFCDEITKAIFDIIR